ncbi:MAG: DUF3284 domain-containing protein [Streptococcaceae bacterium]|jgi:hypothetical protein|nr:DUF3284 domain-containing protein [Streptococcaceae bacterium]
MKVVKTIAVPCDIAFHRILESGLYDVKKYVGYYPKVSELSGFEYEKKFQNKTSGKIRFDEVTEPSVYAFTSLLSKGSYQTRWEFRKVSEVGTEVTMTELPYAEGKFQQAQASLVGFLMSLLKKRSIRTVLEKIEQAYEENAVASGDLEV